MDKKKIIAIIILVIAAIIGWYFMYFTKTPAYSLNMARESVEKHDVLTFKKHVDLERVLDSALDDFISVELEKPEIKNNPFKGLARNIFNSLKPEIVKELTDECYAKIADDKTDENNEKSNTNAATPADKMKAKTGIGQLKFKEMKDAVIVDDKAILPVICVFENDPSKEVTLQLEMKRLEDKTWQVIRVYNFKEYIELMESK